MSDIVLKLFNELLSERQIKLNPAQTEKFKDACKKSC